MLHFLQRFSDSPFLPHRNVFTNGNVERAGQQQESAETQEKTLDELKQDCKDLCNDALTWIDGHLNATDLNESYRGQLTEMRTKFIEVRDATYDRASVVNEKINEVSKDFYDFLMSIPGVRENIMELENMYKTLAENADELPYVTRDPELITEAKNAHVNTYVDTLNSLPVIQLPEKRDAASITAYYNALQARTTSVGQEFTKMQRELTKEMHGQRLITRMSQLDAALRNKILDATRVALEPVKNEIDNPDSLKDDERLPNVLREYTRVQAGLNSLNMDVLNDAELARNRSSVTQQLRDTTGLNTLDLNEEQAKKNPLLAIIMAIAKAFGVQIYVDRDNRVVGWGGGNRPGSAPNTMSAEQRDSEFMLVASNYIEQHQWMNDFNRMGIIDMDTRASLSGVLLNSRCFPVNAEQGVAITRENIGNIRDRRNALIEKVAEINSPSAKDSIQNALDYLDKHPLEIVKGEATAEKGKQLHVSDFAKYVENYRSFYEQEENSDATTS